jgi:hypothetical protein
MTECTEDAGGWPAALNAQQASGDAADLRAGTDELAGLVNSPQGNDNRPLESQSGGQTHLLPCRQGL